MGPSLPSRSISSIAMSSVGRTATLNIPKVDIKVGTGSISGLKRATLLDQRLLQSNLLSQSQLQSQSQSQIQQQQQAQEQSQEQAQMQQQALLQSPMLYTPQVTETKLDYKLEMPEMFIEEPVIDIETPKPKTKTPRIVLPDEPEEPKKKKYKKKGRKVSIAYKEKRHEVPNIWKQATTKKKWSQRSLTKKPKYIKLTK